MNAELDDARVAGAGIKTVAPLKPWLALRAGRAGIARHHGRLEHRAGGLGRLDAHAPVAVAVGLLVGDERVVAVQGGVVSGRVGEVFISGAAGNVGGVAMSWVGLLLMVVVLVVSGGSTQCFHKRFSLEIHFGTPVSFRPSPARKRWSKDAPGNDVVDADFSATPQK